MPRLELNLGALEAGRARVRELGERRRQLDLTLAEAQAGLEQAERQGTGEQTITDLRQRLEAAVETRRDLIARLNASGTEVDEAAEALLAGLDPARLVESLDAALPIALLPMRLETRYVNGGSTLRIRVYPDDLNIVEHEPALTAAEREAGERYWTFRFAGSAEEAERTSRDLTLTAGRSRCGWVLRVLTPTNAEQAGEEGAAPQFPDPPAIDARARQTRALLLPDRWCAVGYGAGRRELFRVWGRRIADELVLTPDWTRSDAPEALLEGERAWLVDFDAAMATGMALEVNQAAVDAFLRRRGVAPFVLARDTIERLIVVGLEWSKDPGRTAADLAELLAAQRDSDGLAFVPLATPTNNTEAARSGYSPAQQRTPPPAPASGEVPPEKDALDLLVEALGLDGERLDAAGIEGAGLSEQSTALHMMNLLWRATFGHYLGTLWNPDPAPEEKDRLIGTEALYELRRYAVAHLRPSGPLPLLRVGHQPYGILPVVGKGFEPDPPPARLLLLRDPQRTVEVNIGKVLSVLRPLWERASENVPLLRDGDVARARDILQTAPWSQTAAYRNADDNICLNGPVMFDVSGVQPPLRAQLMGRLLAALGISRDLRTLPMYACVNFPPDRSTLPRDGSATDDLYPAASLEGVPWVLADPRQPGAEAPAEALLPPAANYLAQIAEALGKDRASADRYLSEAQAGPNLLQALAACSVQMERHDAVQNLALSSGVVSRVLTTSTSRLVNIESAYSNETVFRVSSPMELAGVVIPSLTGRAALGDYVADRLAAAPVPVATGTGLRAGSLFLEAVGRIQPALRDVSGVRRSLTYLAGRSVGELNTALRTTLDAFSHRLDAWYTARAHRRLAQLRERTPRGLHAGGYAWVENLRPDARPESEGHLLAPSQGQAAAAALLRSGYMANHEQGAFGIQLDSRRVRRAQDVLQGLTRDQPLAALYGYRVERALRDGLLGKLIWPLRLAYPWHPVGGAPGAEAQDAIGARDVVDGVALLEAWQTSPVELWKRLSAVVVNGRTPFATLTAQERGAVEAVLREAEDLADAVGDLLMAEGTYQIAVGNFDRAGAAMAVADKQTLPIETAVGRTPRGGASYTQRLALLAPAAVLEGWPQDRRSRAEPALDRWLAHMLGDPGRYGFSAIVRRGEGPVDGEGPGDGEAGEPAPETISVSLADLGCSALTAVLTATESLGGTAAGSSLESRAETGFRARLAAALIARVVDPATVRGLDITSDPARDLGLSHFEAFATTLRALLEQGRPMTRKDLVVPDDALEKDLSEEGAYPGVDAADLQARADALIAEFQDLRQALVDSATADALLEALAALEDFLPRASWPPEVVAIDAAGADPAMREERSDQARLAVAALLESKAAQLETPIPLADGQLAPTPPQRVQKAIDRIRLLLGREFPVLPRFALGPYAAEFGASLADQEALTAGNPWRVPEWLPQVARVRPGADRFTAALTAHETLVDLCSAEAFRVVQVPHRPGHAWAALPEAWREPEDAPADPARVPEELRAYLAARGGPPLRDINRAAPKLAVALHAPGGLEPPGPADTLAGLVCDDWPEFIPDPFQTAAIAFHYDAPGARAPQTILLAVPPRPAQEQWTFDDVLDVLHEAWDLARLRAVRPRDLGSGLGLLLPANYLPHEYTGDLPGVRALELARRALRRRLQETVQAKTIFPLGKF